MRWLLMTPMLVFVLLAYNLVGLTGSDPTATLAAEIISASLISGATFRLTTGELLVLAGVFALFIEMFKATRSSIASVIDHALSTLVFAAYLIEFLIVKIAGTGVFLVLTVLSLLDLIAGFTVTISAARRDLTIDR